VTQGLEPLELWPQAQNRPYIKANCTGGLTASERASWPFLHGCPIKAVFVCPLPVCTTMEMPGQALCLSSPAFFIEK
jgi:hypothetical protein